MDLVVRPAVTPTAYRALLVALDQAGMPHAGRRPDGDAWRRAALREAVDDDRDADYAFSPRSTRGATRA